MRERGEDVLQTGHWGRDVEDWALEDWALEDWSLEDWSLEDWSLEDWALEDDGGTQGTDSPRLPGSVGGSLGLEGRGRGGSGGGQGGGAEESECQQDER